MVCLFKTYDATVFSIFQNFATTTMHFRIFSSAQKKPKLVSGLLASFPIPSNWKLQIYSVSIDSLVRIVHLNGTIPCVLFCDRLLSISIMCLRFIHVEAYQNFISSYC